MIPQFEGLSHDEQELMFDAIPLITIYIAGADGNIDQEEKEWAEKITKIRSYSYHESLQPYYTALTDRYSDKVSQLFHELPKEVDERTAAISEKLSGLNSILAKMDVNLAARFYKTFVSFAKHVAKASGGFLGIGSISRAESQLIGMDMITPIVIEEDVEEGEDL